MILSLFDWDSWMHMLPILCLFEVFVWVEMAIGHNIITSLSAAGSAHSAHVGVRDSNGGMVYSMSMHLLYNF